MNVTRQQIMRAVDGTRIARAEHDPPWLEQQLCALGADDMVRVHGSSAAMVEHVRFMITAWRANHRHLADLPEHTDEHAARLELLAERLSAAERETQVLAAALPRVDRAAKAGVAARSATVRIWRGVHGTSKALPGSEAHARYRRTAYSAVREDVAFLLTAMKHPEAASHCEPRALATIIQILSDAMRQLDAVRPDLAQREFLDANRARRDRLRMVLVRARRRFVEGARMALLHTTTDVSIYRCPRLVRSTRRQRDAAEPEAPKPTDA